MTYSNFLHLLIAYFFVLCCCSGIKSCLHSCRQPHLYQILFDGFLQSSVSFLSVCLYCTVTVVVSHFKDQSATEIMNIKAVD